MKSKRQQYASSSPSSSASTIEEEKTALQNEILPILNQRLSADQEASSSNFNRKFYLPTSSENALYRCNRPHLPMSSNQSPSNEVTDENKDADEKINSQHIQMNIDVDWSMRMMDKLWNATLYEFIKDEENCECTAKYISQIMKEYSLQQCVQALQWLLNSWRPEMKARFLRICFADYDPVLAGSIFGILSKEWEFERDLTINTALILLKEPATVASEFIVAMTNSWSPERVTELVSCLDCVLDWSEKFFQEFTGNLIRILKEQQQNCKESEFKRVEELLKHLSLLYEVNLAETNLRLALADYQLALAEHKLRTVTRILAADGQTQERPISPLEEDFLESPVLDRPEE